MSMVLPRVLATPRRMWRRAASWLHARMPKGLYARALLIVILPIVLLQSAVAYVFMERHWEVMTYRLSAAVARDVAAAVDMYASFPEDRNHEALKRIAALDLGMEVAIQPKGPLPAPKPKPLFSLLDHALSQELGRHLKQPVWIDTVSRYNVVEIRVELDDAVLALFAMRTQARRISWRARSTVPSSTPATARMSIPRRRCSTR